MSIKPPVFLLKPALFVVFTVSGFSGLIYESIWSHYLKLMLGHAAYAQTLVLSIFMGGMALGAWLASQYSKRIAKPLLVYSAAEMGVGLLALAFHTVFAAMLAQLYDHWLPALDSPALASLLKWSLGALIILPQSILLGTTFPLMSAGFIRLFPKTPGAGLGLLYFANSLGAAVGVLVSVFVLIPRYGLPGTMMTAGLINAGLAMLVWLLASELDTPALEEAKHSTTEASHPLLKPVLLIALLSSLASFCYEIGWIRMLSLVLGSSVQAFELMLSAFILGLAFGGFWIRKRLDHIASPLRFAGHVQIIMGVLAATTIPLYLYTYDIMVFLFNSVLRNDGGYSLFNLGSQLIAMLVMLPATFTAGMTLPLFTYTLIKVGEGERSIGRVYSANTVGAILGVLLAVHLLLPLVGLKGLIGAGAMLDVAVGVALLLLAGPKLVKIELPLSAGLAGVFLVAVLSEVQFDPLLLSSGVYRYGQTAPMPNTESLFYRDGKTASVSVRQIDRDLTIISTNGKPDASINITGKQESADEITMTMAAATPLALHPDAKSAAVIGFGSGMTTNTLLGAHSLESVDTIEIEPQMVEGARHFGPFVERAFIDPRSHIHIEDAKSYFSTHNKQYDIIVSEPSNPWVSGVASLFTDEFYQHIQNHLKPDGLFVQWLQLYEINQDLVSSVFKALGKNFPHYVIYLTVNEDILIIASQEGKLGQLNDWIFREPGLLKSLSRVGLNSLADLRIRRIGSNELLQPLFDASYVPMNSDYYPYLSHQAPKARFLKETAKFISEFQFAPLPILEMLDQPRSDAELAAIPANFSQIPKTKPLAGLIAQTLTGTGPTPVTELQGEALPVQLLRRELLNKAEPPYAEPLILDAAFRVSKAVNPFLPPKTASTVWDQFFKQPSFQTLSPELQNWFTLFKAVAERNGKTMANTAAILIQNPTQLERSQEQEEYLLSAAMLGFMASGEPKKIRDVFVRFQNNHQGMIPSTPRVELLMNYINSKL